MQRQERKDRNTAASILTSTGTQITTGTEATHQHNSSIMTRRIAGFT